MATNKVENENVNQELKHLGFVRIAVVNALIYMSTLYGYAKQNSGPLRSAVQTVEGAVTTVASPVLEKLKGVPEHLLVFLDGKVDEATVKFDELAPPLAKQVANQSWLLLQKATQLTQTLVHETKTKGVAAAAKDVVNNSEQLLLEKAAKAWVKLDQVTLFHTVAEMVVPTVAHWSDKYNQFVVTAAKDGFAVFNYLPLVPVDKIAKAFKSGEGEVEVEHHDE